MLFLIPKKINNLKNYSLVDIFQIDETFSQLVHSRGSYRYNEIKWDAKFIDMADSSYKGPLCQARNRYSELKSAESGPTTADRGRHRVKPARSSCRSGT
jgi:hypothetical protein